MLAVAMVSALSATISSMITMFLSPDYIRLGSNFLFLLFGLCSLVGGFLMEADENEYDEAQEELQKSQAKKPNSFIYNLFLTFVSAVFIEAFTITFLAEIGDSSQITTIVLASDHNPH